MSNASRTLERKVAWITGSGRGIGRANALELARRGADIIVHDLRVDEANETAEAVRAVGRRVVVSNESVTDFRAMRELVGRAESELGPIDILVNNAGSCTYRPIEEISPAEFDKTFDINVKGSFACAQAVIPSMKKRRSGKIINTSSIWGMTGAATSSDYCAAKAAVLGLTKAWAKELAPWRINVNAVSPGGVITEKTMTEGLDTIREKESKIPLGRWGRPEEIAFVVAFLASAESDFITGQIISPNGGETISG